MNKIDDDRITGDATIQVDPAGGEKKTPSGCFAVGYYGEESVISGSRAQCIMSCSTHQIIVRWTS